MQGGPGFWGPPGMRSIDKLKVPPPKHIREVPGYLKKLLSGFFSRLFYIYRLVWEAKPFILFFMLFMAVFNGVMPIAGAYISRALINSLVKVSTQTVENAWKLVSGLLVLQFAYTFVNHIFSNINSMVTRVSGELVVNHIKVKIMNKARDIDLASFDQPAFYEKLENASREADRRPIQILSSTFSMMSTIISMVSFIIILWAVSPAAPFVIIALSIPSAVINFRYRRKNVNYMRHRSKDRRQMSYYSDLLVNKDMVKEVRLFNLSDTFIGRFKEVFRHYFAGLRKLIVGEGIWNVGISFVSVAVNCALFLYVAYKVVNGELQVGDYTLYTGALNTIANGVTSLINTTATIYEGTLFIDNMIAFMNEPKTVVPLLEAPARVEHGRRHKIVFDHVYFRYPGTERDVLRDVCVEINAGETVVLVGLNGAGKTTLLKLLTRLYDPTDGVIYLDGRDMRDYDVADLYETFGIIFQDFGKYAVSVRENIEFGDVTLNAGEAAVKHAAEQSSADQFIERLKYKYNTPLMRIFEEEGIELSIGQWQKLAAARAFYAESDIVILDEPTASLDPMAEQEIFNQFDELSKEKTTIFVSHRLSSATRASKIIVLENGQIIEMGNHAQLMAAQGKYCELFSTQARRYITTENDSIAGAEHPPRPPRMNGDMPRRRHGDEGEEGKTEV